MSERNTTLLLSDIRSSIIKILEYTAGMDFESYEADAKTKDATERNFEINNLIVWDIIQHRLPDLLTKVSAMIPSENDN